MEELLALLAYYPEHLGEWIAQPETWMQPMASPPTAGLLRLPEPVSALSRRLKPTGKEQTAGTTLMQAGQSADVREEASTEPLQLKLYQPAHQRYYLVAASLVCGQYGFPDHHIDLGRQEAAGYVIRRVVYAHPSKEDETPYDPDDPDWEEYAFVAAPDGFVWKAVPFGKRDALTEGEERTRLFNMNFNEANGRRRRMLAGLIPVGKREAYLAAPKSEEDRSSAQSEEQKERDPRRVLFEAQVTSPWGALVEQAKMTSDRSNVTENPFPNFDWDDGDQAKAAKDAVRLKRTSREQIQTISWYILLDFAKFLNTHLPDVLANIADPAKAIEDDDTARREAKQKLVNILNTINVEAYKSALTSYFYDTYTEIKQSLAKALVSVMAKEVVQKLEAVDVPYLKDPREHSWEEWNPDPDPKSVWPDFLFPLADPGENPGNGPLPDIKLQGVDEASMDELDRALAKIDELADLIEQALPSMTAPPPEIQTPAPPGDASLDPRDGWFVVRCVYERPNCGPLRPAVVSMPTEKFLMARFFDPDAPARPVRISLPMDISPAGLRKFKKNATLMMSDMLCGKVGEIRKLTFGDLVLSVLPWPFHKDLPEPNKPGPCKKGNESFGTYCSLSIPIVTLAALILLIIIVSLFDMFFRWVPYLFTCFPIPGFKGKKA